MNLKRRHIWDNLTNTNKEAVASIESLELSTHLDQKQKRTKYPSDQKIKELRTQTKLKKEKPQNKNMYVLS